VGSDGNTASLALPQPRAAGRCLPCGDAWRDEVRDLEVLDITGKRVRAKSFSGRDVLLDTDQLPRGVYVVRIWLRDYSGATRLVRDKFGVVGP